MQAKLLLALNLLVLIIVSVAFGVVGFLVYIIGYHLLKSRPIDVEEVVQEVTFDLYVPKSSPIKYKPVEDILTVPKEYYSEYREYLKSETWKSLRKEALKRDNHRCVRCGYIGNLQVHHTNYNGIRDHMSFTVDQLESICKECHTDVHKGILPMKKDI